jgi:medium-chain acyl-[acyl-carrier-protein] hydrolase
VSTPVSPWLVRLKPRSGARRRLLCVPYAGVGPSVYRRWAEALPADIEVGVVHLPGREGRLRETPFTRIEPLIDAASMALRPYLDLPFAMFGHSMGALVAFELARRFRDDDGSAPTHLFVSGRRAPHLPSRHPAITHLPTSSPCFCRGSGPTCRSSRRTCTDPAGRSTVRSSRSGA